MRRIPLLLALCCTALAFLSTDPVGGREDKKGTTVTVDGLTSTTPATWKEEPANNKMRLTQFKLPKHKDDSEDAELVIFKGLGGGSAKNVERWQGQFIPPEGKKIEDVTKVTEIKIAGKTATMVEIQGTYKYNPAPFNPSSKTVPKENFRMIAVYFDGPDDVYQFRVTGPAKTIEQHQADFDKWVKGFK